jgi:hypothetical protein
MIITLEILVETLEEAVILDKVGKIIIPIPIWVVVDLIKAIILSIIITCQIIITKVEIWVVVVDKEIDSEDKEIVLEDKAIDSQVKAVRVDMEAKEIKVIILQFLIPSFNNSVNIIIKHNVSTQINVRDHMLLQKMIA